MGVQRRNQHPGGTLENGVKIREVNLDADASTLQYYQDPTSLRDLTFPKDPSFRAPTGVQLPPRSPDSLYNERDVQELIERAPNRVVKELFNTPSVQRLLEIYQMAARFTVRGESMDHVRAVHVGLTAESAVRIGENLGLGQREIVKLSVAALLHDLKHPPLAHQGEYIIHKFDPSFDHDNIDLTCPEYKDVAKVLWRFKISPKEISDILREDGSKQNAHLRFIVKECADRIAYLKLDSRNSGLSTEVKEWIDYVADRFERGLVLTQRLDGLGYVATNDKESLRLLLSARRIIFENEAQHPAAITVNHILIHAVSKAVEGGAFLGSDGKFDVAAFAKLTDKDVIPVLRNFAPEAYRWLQGGIERNVTPAMAFRLSDMTAEGRRFVQSEGFQKSIRELLADLLPKDYEACFACTTLADDKSVRMLGFRKESGAKPGTPIMLTCDSPMPETRRFAFVVLANDMGEAAQDEAAARIHLMMRPYLKKSAEPLTDLIFSDLAPRLYSGTPLSRSAKGS